MRGYEPLSLGPKFVSGQTERGRVILVRDDETTDETPVWMFTGVNISDNGDGTATLTFEDEE